MKRIAHMLTAVAIVAVLCAAPAPLFADNAEPKADAAPAPVAEIKPAPKADQPGERPEFDPDATGPDKVPVEPNARALPANPFVAEAERIEVEMKKVAFLGIGTQPLNPETGAELKLPEGIGLSIVHVVPDTPAAEAGLRVGDVLHKVDDQLLTNSAQLRTLVRMHKPGDQITVTVVRDGKPVELKAKLMETEVPAVEPQAIEIAPGVQMHRLIPGEQLQLLPGDAVPQQLQNDPKFRQIREQIEQMQQQHMEMLQRLNEQHGEAGQRQAELMKRMLELQQRAGAGAAGAANASATVAMSDGEHSLRYTMNNGDKHLTAKDKDGNVLFEGPVNTDEQKAKIPAAIRPKFDKLEKGTVIRMKVLPDPFAPAPDAEEKDQVG